MKKKKQSVYDYSYDMQQKRKKNISFFVTLVVGLFVFLNLVISFILFPIHTKSKSMEPNVVKGGCVFVSPLLQTPKRGDIFFISRMDGYKTSVLKGFCDCIVRFVTLQKISVFSNTGDISSSPFVRRVLGLPGDTIYMKDFVLYIKPKDERLYLTEFELCSKSYDVQIFSIPAEWNEVGVSGDLPERTLGDDEYFVLADNRVECLDSRHWGEISSKRFIGKLLMEYFPFNKIRFF